MLQMCLSSENPLSLYSPRSYRIVPETPTVLKAYQYTVCHLSKYIAVINFDDRRTHFGDSDISRLIIWLIIPTFQIIPSNRLSVS